ncbi:MAG TPA: hypothetical protein VI749_05265 [Candidatus Omnitrophota bacterium]|nr:hypothetical protein [Candidatus Omnitrophota bacterium]
MKKALFVSLTLLLAGCAYEGQTLKDYLEDPRAIIQDPHFTDYKQQRDDLEGQYLRKEITYAEYVERMDELDNDYTKEVQERDAILSQ